MAVTTSDSDEVVGFQRLEIEIDRNHLCFRHMGRNAELPAHDQPNANLGLRRCRRPAARKFGAAIFRTAEWKRGPRCMDDKRRSGPGRQLASKWFGPGGQFEPLRSEGLRAG